MGMDGVLLILEVEDHFGVTLTDAECSHVITVGDLVALCRKRLLARDGQPCPSLGCFLKLRSLVREVTHPHLRIRPSTRLDATLSPQALRELWRRLPRLLPRSPPKLETTPWVAWLALASYLSAIAVLCITQEFPFGLLGSLALAAPLYCVATAFRSVPPQGYRTFGEITQIMVSMHMATNRSLSADPAVILDELRTILVRQLGLKPSEVVPSARLIQDLGLD